MIKPNEVCAAVILAILGQLPAKELSLKTLGQDPRLEPFSYAVLQANLVDEGAQLAERRQVSCPGHGRG
ncbi:hypothetical protein LCGC14_1337190 [marine sediment metagenome]|uniref:Uncharacterized protein n=1 Tax=marine sediment metagenome TaxID=412755 RepID=A0A0F9L121_9ZZZZ